MDYVDIALKLANIPLTVVLMAVVALLYKQKTDSERTSHTEITALVERYHVLVSEQVRTLTLLNEKLE